MRNSHKIKGGNARSGGKAPTSKQYDFYCDLARKAGKQPLPRTEMTRSEISDQIAILTRRLGMS